MFISARDCGCGTTKPIAQDHDLQLFLFLETPQQQGVFLAANFPVNRTAWVARAIGFVVPQPQSLAEMDTAVHPGPKLLEP